MVAIDVWKIRIFVYIFLGVFVFVCVCLGRLGTCTLDLGGGRYGNIELIDGDHVRHNCLIHPTLKGPSRIVTHTRPANRIQSVLNINKKKKNQK